MYFTLAFQIPICCAKNLCDVAESLALHTLRVDNHSEYCSISKDTTIGSIEY